MKVCTMGYVINEDGTVPERCHVDWDDGFYPTTCKECPSYANSTVVDCEYCSTPFKHCGQFYIVAGRNNDPYLHIIRKENSVGGAMIKYCPWCGRELDPWYYGNQYEV